MALSKPAFWGVWQARYLERKTESSGPPDIVLGPIFDEERNGQIIFLVGIVEYFVFFENMCVLLKIMTHFETFGASTKRHGQSPPFFFRQ